MPPSPSPQRPRREFLSQLGRAMVGGHVIATAMTAAAQPGKTSVADAPSKAERVFRETRELFANPERGFYAQRRSDRLERLGDLRAQGVSLLLVTFDLRDCKERDLPEERREELSRAFSVAREQGFKVIFRAAYGFTGQDYRADPHDLGRIVAHVREIGAVLAENVDVLSGIQAGMLGPWGEWHGSNHGNPPSLEARRAVLFGWLDAVPAPITVHVRRPMFIRDIFATEPGGFDLTEAEAFSGSRLSRTGWHNDAFLVRPSDLGTYAERGWSRERELEWCSRHGRFTPFGGETVHTDSPMPVDDMVREMELLHATYLNIGYHPRVVQLWRESEVRGENAFQHIARRLGYRFVAERLAYARVGRRGATTAVELSLKNSGFATPHLPRRVEMALLSNDGTAPVLVTQLPAADPRRWGADAGVVSVHAGLSLPSDLRTGKYQLAIRFADPAGPLSNDGRHAIRLANADIAFLAATGWNILADDISVG